MKRIAFLALVMATALSMLAEKKPAEKNVKTLGMREWVANMDWKSPKRTGVPQIDEIYDESDKMCNAIKMMSDSVPVFSLRSLVENGDTVGIFVVDENNRPCDFWSKASLYYENTAYTAKIASGFAGLTKKYASLIKDLPDIVKDKGFASFGIIKDFGSNSKKIAKISKDLLPKVKASYQQSENLLKEYAKAQASMSSDDGFVTTGFDHVPEFDPDDMPSDEELDIYLERERNGRNQ